MKTRTPGAQPKLSSELCQMLYYDFWRRSLTNLLIIIVILISCQNLNSQVVTRVLSPKDSIQNYIHWFDAIDDVSVITTKNVDYLGVLLDDKRTGRVLPRIGIQQDISITTSDGSVTYIGSHAIWNIKVKSPDSKSLSIRFENTVISDQAIMYLYNEMTHFVVGPISSKDFRNGYYKSDYINGDYVNITIFIPNFASSYTAINISGYDFGIIALELYDADFNTSGSCNVNTSCPEGDEWGCEINSVCKIIHPYIGSCSGALINNACCDLTPYVLTANHCVLSYPTEEYIFRFNYNSPECTPSGETHPIEWVVYSGAKVIAKWYDSDFALLELFNDTEAGMTYAGWDRSTAPNHGIVTCIHHPAGDVKKISIDNESPILDDSGWIIDEWLVDDWDIGTTEGGSSGSPLFDIDKHIIGQDHRGDGNDPCEEDKGSYYGRLDLSWDGNGTSVTRLSDWLGMSINPMTVECQARPGIQGSGVLCSDDNYSLINGLSCAKDISWNVSPTYLFDSSTSGVGTLASLSAASSTTSGLATITFSLTSEGCNPILIQKKIWVGKPATPDIQMTIDPCLNIIKLFDANYSYLANAAYQAVVTVRCGSTVTVYNVSGMPKTLHVPFGRGCEICLESVSVTNICGIVYDEPLLCQTVTYCGEELNSRPNYNYSLVESNYKFEIYPNPTFKYLTIDNLSPLGSIVTLLDMLGRNVYETTIKDSKLIIDLSSLNIGIYYVLIQDLNGSFVKKIIKS